MNAKDFQQAFRKAQIKALQRDLESLRAMRYCGVYSRAMALQEHRILALLEWHDKQAKECNDVY